MIDKKPFKLGATVYFYRKFGLDGVKLRRGKIESFIYDKDGWSVCIVYSKNAYRKRVPIEQVYLKRPKNEQAN